MVRLNSIGEAKYHWFPEMGQTLITGNRLRNPLSDHSCPVGNADNLASYL